MPNVPPSAGARLPDLVLLAIFRYFLTGTVIIPPPPNDDRERVMLVCHRWRTLLESSPTFWATVVFLPIISHVPDRFYKLAQTWLQRSEGAFVSIEFDDDFEGHNPESTFESSQQIAYGAGDFCIVDSIIRPCAQRIISLKCCLATDSTIRAFLTIPPRRFLALHQVELTLVNRKDKHQSEFYYWEPHMFNVFQSLPFLVQVRLRILNGTHPFELNLPWDQLITLHLGATPIPPDVFLRIVEMTSPSLVEGHFQVKFTVQKRGTKSRRRPTKPELFRTVVAFRLRNLHLILIDPSHDPRMFAALRLPALNSLRVELDDVKRGWDLKLYIPMLATIHFLRRLNLTQFDSPNIRTDKESTMSKRLHRIIPYAEMEALFEAIPAICTLTFALGIHINSPTLEKMAKGEFMPLLEHLHLGSVNGGHILSMVQRRNSLVEYPERMVKSSSFHCGVKSISILYLLIPAGDLNDLWNKVDMLGHSCDETEIELEGREARLFYHLL